MKFIAHLVSEADTKNLCENKIVNRIVSIIKNPIGGEKNFHVIR